MKKTTSILLSGTFIFGLLLAGRAAVAAPPSRSDCNANVIKFDKKHHYHTKRALSPSKKKGKVPSHSRQKFTKKPSVSKYRDAHRCHGGA